MKPDQTPPNTNETDLEALLLKTHENGVVLNDIRDSNEIQAETSLKTIQELQEVNSSIDLLIEIFNSKVQDKKFSVSHEHKFSKEEIEKVTALLESIRDKKNETEITININGAEIGEVKLVEEDEEITDEKA